MMPKNQLQQAISHAIKQSYQWKNQHKHSLSFERFEGQLTDDEFNQAVIDGLHIWLDFEPTQAYHCGFELEFYIEPNKLQILTQTIADGLPKNQMLLVDTSQVHPSNGLNFYLMAENTGKPPKGMKSYEIVSPILDYKFLPYYLNLILKSLKKVEAKDNEDVGFHLHVSTPKSKNLSPISLIYHFDQAQLLQDTPREFTRDIVSQFMTFSPDAWSHIYQEVIRKCYNLNLVHFDENNRAEIRTFGGKGYLDDIDHFMWLIQKSLQAYENSFAMSDDALVDAICKNYSLQRHLIEISELTPKQLIKKPLEAIWHPRGF
jgi:hypothetical protein